MKPWRDPRRRRWFHCSIRSTMRWSLGWCSLLVPILLIMFSLVSGLFNPLWNMSAWRTSNDESSCSSPLTIEPRVANIPSTARQIHLIVLVHGWMGNSKELGYLQQALEREGTSTDDPSIHFVVHSAQANDGQTSDGIAAGGTRLAGEINQLIGDLEDRSSSPVSLSLVGNSLGGLYARYALKDIRWQDDRLAPNVFCTTSTPHLGVSQHTFLPLPRPAEYLVATAMQPTGSDLFRFSSVLDQMTTDEAFVAPLARFRQRIAYANAYRTDFQVPTATAAFLADCDSPHHRMAMEHPNVTLAVTTEARTMPAYSRDEPLTTAEMATRLDALGWTKVFCDVRDSLPSVPLPFGPSSQPSDQESILTSRQLLEHYAGSDRLHMPLGHTVMVANSKNDFYARLNAAGQPIMDQLAKTMVEEILK